MNELMRLVELIHQRNELAAQTSGIIQRPCQIGHVGEYIASSVFGIALEESAAAKAIDGRFANGPLVGKTVNVKWYGKREGLLDITPNELPDYYLVMTGPKSAAGTSRGDVRPWLIESVFLFDAVPLVAALQESNVKIGVATSVRKQHWEAAEIYPVDRNQTMRLSKTQIEQLTLFGSI